MIGEEITVTDAENYNPEYRESTPFKARILKIVGISYWVQSNDTGKFYELYRRQIKELEED